MWWMWLSSVWATSCRWEPVWARVLTDDGSAQLIIHDGSATCWWTINDQDERSFSGRWGGRRPAAAVPWGPEGLLLLLTDPAGYRVHIAPRPGWLMPTDVVLTSAPETLRLTEDLRLEVGFREADGSERRWTIALDQP